MSFRLWNFKEVGPEVQNFLPKIITLKINHCTYFVNTRNVSPSKIGHDFRKDVKCFKIEVEKKILKYK